MSTKKQQKQTTKYIMATFIVLVIVALIFVVVTGKKDYYGFATCLADEGFVMAGTSWCHYCGNQKELFKGAFEDVIMPAGAYKDCDVEQVWCTEAGIEGFPTWVTPEGNTLSGVQQLNTLSRISGCSLS